MKSKFIRTVIATFLLLFFGFIAYRAYGWWQLHQKRKQLFVYLQKESPVTKKIPADAEIYINLFDFKRIHANLQDTKFYEVLTYWLDTGMDGKQKANPVMGSMLEKTILNVIGEELGFSVLPSTKNTFNFYAVARLAPGSDFLLKLALASTKNSRRINFEDSTIYAFETKHSDFPEVFVYVDDQFAYAASDHTRIKKSLKTNGVGPVFLADLEVQAIPESTFVFMEAMNPKLSAVLYGDKNIYHLKAKSEGEISGSLPYLKSIESAVLQLHTNGTEIFNQPSTSYSLQSISGIPASSVLLTFSNAERAQKYSEVYLRHLASKDASSYSARPFTTDDIDCNRVVTADSKIFVCNRDANIFMTQDESTIMDAAPTLKERTEYNQSLTLKVEFDRRHIANYFQMLEKEDWSRFDDAKAFYFLSCVKRITGSIDRSEDEITAELY